MNGVEALTLIPQSGIQFVEYGFDLQGSGQFSRAFIERPQPPAADGSIEATLLPNWNEFQPSAEPPIDERDGDDAYSLSKTRAIEVFLNRWVPVPFLKIQPGRDALGNETYANGPVDWVRVRVVETRKTHGDTEFTHRAVFAFDTTLVNEVPGRPYLGISPTDAVQSEAFRFVHRPRDIAGFLKNETFPQGPGTPAVDSQAWLVAWLKEIFRDARQRQFPHRDLRPDDFPHVLEHVAAYMTFLGYLAEVTRPARVTLVDTVSRDPRVAPIDVDLVLDVGNSRTCGLLIQSFPNDQGVDLNRSLVLELRDLGNPILAYRDPFESKVELVHAEFGAEDFAKRSGRSRAFFWPSLVRLGPEAARYRSQSEGTEATTGLSSPKRYLWDVDPVPQSWQFRNAEGHGPDIHPLIERSIYRYVNNRGDVLDQLEDDRKKYGLNVRAADRDSAEMLRFSRSSFFTFMLVEIISQALMMINNPGTRRKDREKDTPRRLRSIVMTIPSATPVQEQRIIRSRTEAAIKLLWSLMGWTAEVPGAPKPPVLHTFWDEASSVHLVYLYGEVTQKLGGDIQRLFEVLGRERPRLDQDGKVISERPEKSLRIASVDIGGGTTDVMVTTYHQVDNRALIPVQNFREGFRRAGDDLVRLVIERLVMSAIEVQLTACGLAYARSLLRDRFSDDSPGMSEADKHLRRQFVQGLLRPVALAILEAAENAAGPALVPETRRFADFFPPLEPLLQPGNPILAYLEADVRRRGAVGFSLADVPVALDFQALDDCIRATFDTIFRNIADAIYKLEADVVLLTGRPSCQPGLVRLFRNHHAVTVDRVVAIADYRVGNWYPFRRAAQSVISDPKTTAVVGGMLLTLASGQLVNFTLYTSGIVMRSTARFIGEMETDGMIKTEKIYFSDIELDEKPSGEESFTFTYHSPLRIGYRQLAREDWVAAPLYRLRMIPSERIKLAPPIQVIIARKPVEVEPDASALALLKSEATREEFMIEEATDAQDRSVTALMELKLDTSPPDTDGTYWLDSGILKIA